MIDNVPIDADQRCKNCGDMLSECQGQCPSDDVCCCGDSMKNHQNPFDAGHMPVSALAYYLSGKERPAPLPKEEVKK